MSISPSVRKAQALAIALPAALLGGAYISQYVFGLFPCELCWWQRYPHFLALALALLSFVAPPRQLWIGFAALAIIGSGVIGGYHAGVEYGWWEGLTACTATVDMGANPLDAIMNAPMVRCDQAQWTLFGISLAGWNFLISCAGGIAILALLGRKRAA
ncbi:disulfide bond formation protein B [Altererythrobacter sp.]|uniref:disulfide bond formation protein B n=1 Tax=Altererythrobacter sp. TaxID=1872480 RepID=UPI003D06F38C